MPLSRAAATATRLLDLGYFRIGSDAYADANGHLGNTPTIARTSKMTHGSWTTPTELTPPATTAGGCSPRR